MVLGYILGNVKRCKCSLFCSTAATNSLDTQKRWKTHSRKLGNARSRQYSINTRLFLKELRPSCTKLKIQFLKSASMLSMSLGISILCLLLPLPHSVALAYSDPGKEMMACVDRGEDINACARQTLENFRDVMETGVPELGFPILDPIHVKLISFKFFNLTSEFFDVDLFGFKNFRLKHSILDKKHRTWDVLLELPKINAVGMYRMFGTLPGVDLGTSTGDERFSADSVEVQTVLTIGPKGNNVHVTDIQLSIELDDIGLELECLFPKNGKCCPRKYLKSCNALLTKAVLRFITRDGKNFVKEFQPEIAKQISPIFKDYFDRAIGSVESQYLIDYA